MVEFAKIVPDGIVCFFPSYLYMEQIVSMWNDMVSSRLIFCGFYLQKSETVSGISTFIILSKFSRVC